ncbi:MAG: transmembrane 220 family protein [Saprospiraceae bacterium]
MRITNIILAILFTIFAVVQYNDPDPWLWIGIYLFMALISALAANKMYPSWILRGGMLGCLIGLAILLPDFIDWLSTGAESITQSMKADQPHIELTREFLGLLICTITLGFLLWQGEQKTTRR